MLPSNTLIISSQPTCVVDCGNKANKNMINERGLIEKLNEACSPLNESIHYSKELGDHVIVVLCEIGMIMDQPDK